MRRKRFFTLLFVFILGHIDADFPQFQMDRCNFLYKYSIFASFDGLKVGSDSKSILRLSREVIFLSGPFCEQPHGEVIRGYTSHAQEPEWFTTAPVKAIQKLLDSLGWTIEDVDLFEINEAFAVVTMAAIADLQIPPEKVNVHGGACALGHPIGASGARILVTLLNALEQKGLKRGIAALCIGGGESTAMAIERV